MKAKIQIPEGWVKLKSRQNVRIGDRLWAISRMEWEIIDEHYVLAPVCEEETIIRKKITYQIGSVDVPW